MTLFVKRCVWGGIDESPHYRHLAAHSVPVPRLFGALRDGDGVEVVFLEALTETGLRRDSMAEWRRLLSVLACLNACPVTPDYAPRLYGYEQIGQAGGGVWISGLDSAPPDVEVGAGLRAAGVGSAELPSLLVEGQMLI